MEAPIPTPRLDDDEDVHWALSTASALWGRGERTEALKWLRRAAEQASDVNADVRALELFKAAAEVANRVSSTPPLAPASAPAEATSRPPPAPPARKPGPPPVPPPRPGSVFPPPPIAAASSMPTTTPVPTRPPSVPAPPPRPLVPSVPPGRPAAPQAAMPVRPPPPVAVPTRPIAITAVKTQAAPQAMTPKRRRSFTGEARSVAERADRTERARAPDPARTARAHHEGAVRATPPAQPPSRGEARAAEATHKRRTRSFSDDEASSARHPAPEEADPLPDATIAMPIVTRAQVRAASEQSSIFDDLDEDTRVLSAKHGTHDEIDQALAKLRSPPAPSVPAASPFDARTEPRATAARTPAARGFHEEATTDGTVANGPSSSVTSPSTSRWQPPSERTSPTERPPAAEQAAAQGAPTPKRLNTLPALRVAVLGTGVVGDVRIISLGNDEPPPGAAVAVLVPLTAADGEAVARLFGALD